MPSPFPGMDPYLESHRYWSHAHLSWINYLAQALNESLPTGYLAIAQERLYVVQEDRSIFPAAAILSMQRTGRVHKLAGKANTAVLEADAPLRVTIPHATRREFYIDIVVNSSGKQSDGNLRVVSNIEVLSPANKTPGEGRTQYLRKQMSVLSSDVHLLELDLLRSGQHTVAATYEWVCKEIESKELPAQDYLISLSRNLNRWDFEIWPFTVRQSLPCISIPLMEGEADVIVDLQSVFNIVYDSGPYERGIDYNLPTDPPLKARDALWADVMLEQKGIIANRSHEGRT